MGTLIYKNIYSSVSIPLFRISAKEVYEELHSVPGTTHRDLRKPLHHIEPEILPESGTENSNAQQTMKNRSKQNASCPVVYISKINSTYKSQDN